MDTDRRFPHLRQVVLDCLDPRTLAEFYIALLGFAYRAGDETVDPEHDDWLVIQDPDGHAKIAFQQVDDLPVPTWPQPGVAQQLHLDLTVPTVEALLAEHDHVVSIGARLLVDRIEDPEEPLRTYADPAGHPFCVFVSEVP